MQQARLAMAGLHPASLIVIILTGIYIFTWYIALEVLVLTDYHWFSALKYSARLIASRIGEVLGPIAFPGRSINGAPQVAALTYSVSVFLFCSLCGSTGLFLCGGSHYWQSFAFCLSQGI
jgi:hypothetical protein